MPRRPPKPLTPKRLARQVDHYLQRWFTTRGHLRRLMSRKVDRAIEHHGGDRDEALRWLDAVLDDCEASGLLNDERYALDRARLLHGRGCSRQAIRTKLSQKLVAPALIDQALALLGNASDLQAAAAYVRKKRLGAFRRDPEANQKRDLGRLARAGFSYSVATQVLAATPDELEAIELDL